MKKKIVVIGGGTGTYTVVSGLKHYPVSLSVIVSMMDSGGSNRVIRDEFGLLPVSDLRQVMVALASDKADEVLRNLFTYRYTQGTGISGMTFGNLFMAALTDIYGSQKKAIEKTSEVLRVTGKIIPVTYDNVHLVAKYSNGREVLGEHYIEEPNIEVEDSKISELSVFPKAQANLDAIVAITDADLIILGPGDLYTSIICNLVIDGVSEAIKKSKAKKVFVVNLMTRRGQTDKLTASDHVGILQKYLGGEVLDYCLVEKTEKYDPAVLARYELEKAYPVVDNLVDSQKIRIKRRSLVSEKVFEREKGDNLARSLIRHDSKKLAKAIMELLDIL